MREEYAQSMQRSAHMFRLVVGGALTLRAQLAEQIHYCTFGRINKAALCMSAAALSSFSVSDMLALLNWMPPV